MNKVISFISRKGGTGKTTSAINLATMLHSLGHRVVLIETDTNYTLSTLRQMELYEARANNNALFKILGSDDQKIISDIETFKQQQVYDYIIVDSAGKTTNKDIKMLCLHSDLVIIPTSLTQNDLLVTYQTVEDLKPAFKHSKDLKIIILPNRIHSLTKHKTISKALDELQAQITEHMVPSKNAFANFSTILPEKEFLSIAKEIVSLVEAE